MSDYQLAIIIPAYKQTYLRDTLESIANQTDKNFRLYIGDDCSPYDLKSIVDEFRDRIDLVYRRFDTNMGGTDLVAQWERCIALSEGEPYIWLFSDDDEMEPKCVETFLSTEKDIKDNSLFHFDIKMIDEYENRKIIDLTSFSSQMSAGEFLEAKSRGKIVSYVVEFIFPRELYNKVGGFQNFDLAWGADMMTWLKMASRSPLGIYTPAKSNRNSVLWRKSRENISPDKSYPILKRKIKSYVANAEFIKLEFESHSDKYLPYRKSFRYLRFPLGHIFRNCGKLKFKDISELCVLYKNSVGYSFYTVVICTMSFIKKGILSMINTKWTC